MDAQDCDPTAAEEELLRLAHELTDRLDTLERIVATDGEMLTSPSGVVRIHPAAVEHRQLALVIARVLGGVVVGDSAGAGSKNPVKQRAAAVRWANHHKQQALRGA
jgi:hypothetical protein